MHSLDLHLLLGRSGDATRLQEAAQRQGVLAQQQTAEQGRAVQERRRQQVERAGGPEKHPRVGSATDAPNRHKRRGSDGTRSRAERPRPAAGPNDARVGPPAPPPDTSVRVPGLGERVDVRA